MSTITKERLTELSRRENVGAILGEEIAELARIALASLEADPVCVIDEANLDYLNAGSDADVWPASRKEMGDVLLYRTAPPAPENSEPVAWLWSHRKHPSEVSLVRPEDDEKAEGAHWSGWSCQALYAAQPAPVSVPDMATVEATYPDVQTNWQDAKMYAEGWNACRDDMLQGAENAESRCGNSPVIPDGWVACVERMPSAGEQVLAYRPDAPESNDPLIKMATYVGGSAHGHGFDCYCKPTHWMPLPAEPQQEVTQALAKGMERYGDAMQKLADSGD
jgi:hypothetical protein